MAEHIDLTDSDIDGDIKCRQATALRDLETFFLKKDAISRQSSALEFFQAWHEPSPVSSRDDQCSHTSVHEALLAVANQDFSSTTWAKAFDHRDLGLKHLRHLKSHRLLSDNVTEMHRLTKGVYQSIGQSTTLLEIANGMEDCIPIEFRPSEPEPTFEVDVSASDSVDVHTPQPSPLSYQESPTQEDGAGMPSPTIVPVAPPLQTPAPALTSAASPRASEQVAKQRSSPSMLHVSRIGKPQSASRAARIKRPVDPDRREEMLRELRAIQQSNGLYF